MPKHAAPEAPKKKKGIRIALILFMVVLIGVLGFSVYKFLSEYIPQQREQNRFAELRDLIEEDEYEDPSDPSSDPSESGTPKVKTSKYKKLFAMNEDMRGWIKVNGTQIDYPVMKSDLEDGEYYLHRDFDGDYSFAGCLFIGKYCDYDSDIFIIYGHNMLNGSMFGELHDFSDEDFAKKHMDIQFDTKNERRVYRVFGAFWSKAFYEDEPGFKYYEAVGNYDEDSYNNILWSFESMMAMRLDYEPKYPDQIMLMSTCSYNEANGRFVVAAYRIK